MNAEESIEELLERLEHQLLARQGRKPEHVAALLAEDFAEFGSSGRQFNKVGIMAALQSEDVVQFTVSEFKVQRLSAQIALVTYIALRHTDLPIRTLRSSIWQQRTGQWQMVFHQGTPIMNFA